MVVKRVDSFTVLVGEVKFEYNERTTEYVTFDDRAEEKHHGALARFLTTENPQAEKDYEDYYMYIRKLNKLLLSLKICSVQ